MQKLSQTCVVFKSLQDLRSAVFISRIQVLQTFDYFRLLLFCLTAFLCEVFDLLFVKFFLVLKDIRWFHSSSSLWTKEALNHQTSLKAKRQTVVADPINFWDCLYAKAALMNWHTALTTKHDLIIIFIVSDSADSTACIFLGNLCPLFHAKLLKAFL